MRKTLTRDKQANTSIFTKRQPARGFGLESSHVTSKAAPEQQVVQSKKSRGFDLNRISMRPQAKLTVNKPGDAYEQEADNVAQQVVQRMNNPQEQQTEEHQQQPKQNQHQEKQIQTKSLADSITPVVQRQQISEETQEEEKEQEQEQVQAKSIASPIQRQQESQQQTQEEEKEQEQEQVQTKSIASPVQRQQEPEQEEEQQQEQVQAKSIASPVQRQQESQQQTQEQVEEQQQEQVQAKSIASPVQSQQESQQQTQEEVEEQQQEQVQAKSIASPVQRQQESQQQTQEQEEENIQTKSLVQQKSAGKGKDANAELESSIGKARGGGQPMADDVRQPMEEAIGADFSGVRIHTDSRSDNLNQSIQAKAFTTGQDVFFRQGEYSPGSDGGKELLAHELTHVVQQSGGGVRQKSTPSENAKTNKVQTKLASISQSSEQTIQRKEISQQQVEQQENQGETEQQATATTETQTQEQQIQAAPVEGSVAEIPPTDGGGAAGASTGGAGGTAGTPSGGGEQGGGGNGISGEDPGQIIEQLKNTPPTQAAAAHNQAQSASGEALDNIRQQQQEDMPEIPTPTGLSAEGKSEEKDSKYKYKEKDSKYKEKEPKNNKDNNKKKQKEKEKEEEKKEEEQGNSEKEQPQNNGEKSDIDNVNTDAGERPKVDMSGEADPSQVDDEQAKSDEEVKETKNKEAEGIGEDFGENDIFPDADNEILKAQKEISDFEFPAEEQLEVPQIPGEVVAGLDEGLTPHYQEQVTPEQEKYLEEKQHFDAESEKAKQDSDRQIEEENEKAKQEQTNQQQESQKEVEKLREDWQSELDGKEEEYQKKAGKASKDQRKKIDDEKSKGEKDVDNKMTEAEQEAQKEKEAKQKEAEEKEKEKEEQSGWDRFWSSVGDFFAAIAEAIKGIFDALMDVISKIFEAVKEVVNGIIDLVRDAIIGLIEVFGEILKGIVKVVFAAFPEISKKFTDAIDGAVKKATEVVNKVADGLKKAVSAILDFLAEIVDTLLGVLRDVVAGVINLIGMIISGQIDEVIKGFGRIIEAGKAMPDVFEIAAQEELLGGDELNLHEPLSPEEIAQAQESGIEIPSAEGENAPQAGEAGEIPQAPWTQENVGVDEVDNNMELSPEITEELMQQTGGEGEAMLAESDDESRSMDAIMSETTGEQQAGGEQEQQQVPDDGLTPQQRADIKWQTMWEGIKQWFSDNWPLLLAGLIAATAVIVAAIIASGGAVLAALPALLKVLAIVFAADAIAKITGHLRDYLTKAWDGDIQGGAKSLAKALALGAIEIAMMLTFQAGKAAVKGAKAVGKAGKKAAKGAGKVARKAGRGIAKGAKYTINKGKVLFKGIGNSKIGTQFKKLDDLGKGLLDRMRFKAFRIRVQNRRFRLEGLINPWVLIAQGEITTKKNGQPVDRQTKDATFVSDDELKAVKKGGEPKQSGPLDEYEVLEFKRTEAPKKGTKSKVKRGEVGDDLTGDHIPANGAILKSRQVEAENILNNKQALNGVLGKLDNAQKDEVMNLVLKRSFGNGDKNKIIKILETAAGSKLQPGEIKDLRTAIKDINTWKKNIEDDAVTVVLKEKTHKDLSRTYGGRNTATQIGQDAKDLGQAFRNDAEEIFQGLYKDKALNSDIVGAYMRAYRENVRKGVFQHSSQADDMFMKYLDKVKTGTPNSTGNKRPATSAPSSSSNAGSKKVKTSP